jgi:hypothetical protein
VRVLQDVPREEAALRQHVCDALHTHERQRISHTDALESIMRANLGLTLVQVSGGDGGGGGDCVLLLVACLASVCIAAAPGLGQSCCRQLPIMPRRCSLPLCATTQ